MGKADKDPNRPKKAQSAYFLFMGDYRNHCKQTGECNVSDVVTFTKRASLKWKSMNEQERRPYDARAAADKMRYEQQMSVYVPTPGYSVKGTRRKKNPDGPKRPKSAYLYFLDEFREKNREHMDHKQIISQGAQQWGKLTEEEKLPFNAKHEEAKCIYNDQLKQMNTHPAAHSMGGGPGPSAMAAAASHLAYY